MSIERGSSPEYLIGHIEDALARDPRVSEQGLRVAIIGGPPTVVITGTVVSTPDHRVLTQVVHELLPGVEVLDQTTGADYPEMTETEMMR